jgi:hypothetical protein
MTTISGRPAVVSTALPAFTQSDARPLVPWKR